MTSTLTDAFATQTPQGLSRQEATRRLQTEGPNQLPKPNQRKFLRILRDVLQEPMFMLLIGGGLVYWLLGDTLEAVLLLILAICILR